MIARPCTDPILKRFRTTLDGMYGGRIERVVLFGSGARAMRDGIRIDDPAAPQRPHRALARGEPLGRPQTDILEDTGEFVHAMPPSRRSIQ
jgi:uncharacterized protein